MNPTSITRTLAAAAVAALGLLLMAPEARAERTETPQQPASDLASSLALVTRLVAYPEEALDDAPALARSLPALSEEQQAALKELAQDYAGERRGLLADLNRQYAARAQQVLTKEQAEVYAGAIAALQDLVRRTQAARRAVAEAVGEEAPLPASPGGLLLSVADASELMGLDEARRAEIRRLRDAMHSSLHDALQDGFQTEVWEDLDAWRQRREQVRRAQEQARAEFETARNALLSAEERERLGRIEAALADYYDAVRQARHEATTALIGLLEPSRPAPEAAE